MKIPTHLTTSGSRSRFSALHLVLFLLVIWVLSWIPVAWSQDELEPETREQQEPDDPVWFQIELIVFSRLDGASHGEQWARDLTLRYPFNWVELQDPETPKSWLPDWLEKPINPGLVGAPQLETPEDQRWTPLQVDLERRPYFRLGVNDRNLNAVANTLARKPEYRLLFHQAWRQPMEENQSSPAILIGGGDRFGLHQELEGSVTLSLSRYLHLHTNLWLTEFEPNFGQAPGGWPELPLPPNRPGNDRSAPSLESDPAAPFGQPGGSAWDRFTQTSNPLNSLQTLSGFLREDYLPKRIVAMTQRRRMRSEELHYLDHPLFGLMIKIKPYERPEADPEDDSGSQTGTSN